MHTGDEVARRPRFRGNDLDRYAGLFGDDLQPVATRLDGGGRYWDRTSDPCRVKAVLSR
jgi:hypothetical protein